MQSRSYPSRKPTNDVGNGLSFNLTFRSFGFTVDIEMQQCMSIFVNQRHGEIGLIRTSFCFYHRVKRVDASVLADTHRLSVLPLVGLDYSNGHPEAFGYLCEPHHEIAAVPNGRSLQLGRGSPSV